jgi:hypothetical protein
MASPPISGARTLLSGDHAESAPKGITALFACVDINRGGGRPWPLSWTLIHLCTPFES